MATRPYDLQILFQKRNAISRGRTSSEAFNDVLDELGHDLALIQSQWNNKIVPLTATIPDGTGDADDLNAFENGLGGATLLTDPEATLVSNTAYFNTTQNRPNSILEQFDDVYDDLDALREDLENTITNRSVVANDVSIVDSQSLFNAENVEDALAELSLQVTNAFGSGTGSVNQVAFFTALGTIQGSSTLIFSSNTLEVGGTVLVPILRATNYLALTEQSSSPSAVAGRGHLYTKTDTKLYYLDSAGNEFDLTMSGGSGTVDGTVNQLAYFSNATTVAGTSNVTWNGTVLTFGGSRRLSLDDGTSANPGLTWASDLAAGLYYSLANTDPRVTYGSEDLASLSIKTLSNTEAASNTVRHGTRFYAPTIGGASETGAIYVRVAPPNPSEATNGIYLETMAANSQQSTAIKIIHSGLNDAIYIAGLNTSAAIETASFKNGSTGFISTIQWEAPDAAARSFGNSTLFNGVWGDDGTGGSTVPPNYGMFYASLSLGHSFRTRLQSAAATGWAWGRVEWAITSYDLAHNHFDIYNHGQLNVRSRVSTAGSPTNNDAHLRISNTYWDGAASVKKSVKSTVNATSGKAAWTISQGTEDSESQTLQIDDLTGLIEIGPNTTANSYAGGVAVGMDVSVNGDGIVAIGSGIIVSDFAWQDSVLIGRNASANTNETAGDGIAIGHSALIQDIYGIAIGSSAEQKGEHAIAIGRLATTANLADRSIAIGSSAAGEDNEAIAIGYFASGHNNQSIAIGRGANATGTGSIAVGDHATCAGVYSVAIGKNSTVSSGHITGTMIVGSTTVGSELDLELAKGLLVLPEIPDPGAALANQCRLYCRDNGGGKSQLVVVFPSGAVQVLATEP